MMREKPVGKNIFALQNSQFYRILSRLSRKHPEQSCMSLARLPLYLRSSVSSADTFVFIRRCAQMQNIPTEHTEDTEITALCDDSCTSVYSVVYDFQRHIYAQNVYTSDAQSTFRSWMRRCGSTGQWIRIISAEGRYTLPL